MSAVETFASADHAKRWAERARLDLEASADRGEAGLSKIRTAITERHDIALGYRSIGDYVSTEFTDALGNVCRVFGVEFRRQVVAELSDAGGMSTRAIASVTGTNNATVWRDQKAGVADATPEPTVNTKTGEVSDDYLPNDAAGEEVTPSTEALATAGGATPPADDVEEAPGEEVEPRSPEAPSRPAVTGIDGKTYTPREQKPRRKPITDAFFTASYDLGKRIESVHRLTEDDRFPQNAEKVAASHRNDLLRYRDLLEQVIDRLPEA